MLEDDYKNLIRHYLLVVSYSPYYLRNSVDCGYNGELIYQEQCDSNSSDYNDIDYWRNCRSGAYYSHSDNSMLLHLRQGNTAATQTQAHIYQIKMLVNGETYSRASTYDGIISSWRALG